MEFVERIPKEYITIGDEATVASHLILGSSIPIRFKPNDLTTFARIWRNTECKPFTAVIEAFDFHPRLVMWLAGKANDIITNMPQRLAELGIIYSVNMPFKIPNNVKGGITSKIILSYNQYCALALERGVYPISFDEFIYIDDDVDANIDVSED